MGDRIDLDSYATGTVGDAIYGMTTYDATALREEAQDRVGQDAENACTYTHHCRQIIDDYEREYGSEAEDICDGGQTYKASEFQDAMVAYANAVAYCALGAKVSAILDAVDEAAEELVALLSEHDQSIDSTDLVMSSQCPNGWAAHDSEEADGSCLWVSKQLEGCNAIARDVGPFWLSYTWTPEEPEETEGDGAEVTP